MGYKLIKHLESANYNRKLFYLDHGAQDLPPIVNQTDIQPGSEARDLLTGEKWILNTEYKWIYIGTEDTLLPVPANEEAPKINSITVHPMSITVKPDSKMRFFASVDAEDNETPEVAWAISGQSSLNTKIDHTGLLTIAADEKSHTIIVTATSLATPSIAAQARVSLPYTEEERQKLTNPDLLFFEVNPTTILTVAGWTDEEKNPFTAVFDLNIAGYNIDFQSMNLRAEVVGNTDENTKVEIKYIGGVPKLVFSPGILEHARAIKITAYATVNGETYVANAMAHVEPKYTNKPIPFVVKFDWAPAVRALISNVEGKDTINLTYKAGTDPFIQLAYIIEGVNDFDRTVRFDLTKTPGNSKAYIDVQGRLHFDVAGEYVVDAYPIGNTSLKKELTIVTKQGVAAITPALKISPASISIHQGGRYTFVASAFGNEASETALDSIVWVVEGAISKDTVITSRGILTIGVGEEADTVFVTAYSTVNPSLRDTAIVEVLPVAVKKDGTIEEVPVWPTPKEYVRRMNRNGMPEWRPTHFIPVEDFDANRSEDYSKLIDKITVHSTEEKVYYTIYQYDPIPRKHSNFTMDYPISRHCEEAYPRGNAGSMSGEQAEELHHLIDLIGAQRQIAVGTVDDNKVKKNINDKIQLGFISETDGYGHTYLRPTLSINDYANEVYDRFKEDEKWHINRKEFDQTNTTQQNIVTHVDFFRATDGVLNIRTAVYDPRNPDNKYFTTKTVAIPMSSRDQSGLISAPQVESLESVVDEAIRNLTWDYNTSTGYLQMDRHGEDTRVQLLDATTARAGLMTASHVTRLGKVEEDIITINETLKSHASQISSLNTALTNAKTDLQNQINSLNTAMTEGFSNVVSQVTSLVNTGLKNINTTLTDMDADIEALDDSFSNYKTYVSNTYSTKTATTSEINSALSGYATQTWVNNQGFIKSLSGYATQTWVNNKNYATQSQINDLSRRISALGG